MSVLRSRRAPSLRGLALASVVGTALAAVAGAVLVGLHGSGSARNLLTIGVLVLLSPVAVWLFVSKRTDRTLAVVLVYIGCCDGVVRLVSGSSSATIGRDILLYAVAFGSLARLVLNRQEVRFPPLSGFVFAWVAVVLVQIANPSGISLAHSLISVRPDLEFVPLFFLAYATVQSPDRLRSFLALIVFCAAANGIVGLIQAGLSPAQLASWGPGYRGLIYGTSRQVATQFRTSAGALAVRPPALGGFIGFGGELGVLALPGVVALITIPGLSMRRRWLLVVGLVLSVIGIFTSQARTSIVGALIGLFAFAFLTVTSVRGLRVLAALFVTVLLGFLLYSLVVPTNANRYGTLAPGQLSTTLSSTLTIHGTLSAVPADIVTYPMGAGLGRAGAAVASTVGGATNAGLNGESEFTYLLIETGIPGLLVMFGLFAALVRAGLRFRRVRAENIQRPLVALLAVFVFLSIDWILGAITGSPPDSPFLWASAGVFAFWLQEIRAGRVNMKATRSMLVDGGAGPTFNLAARV